MAVLDALLALLDEPEVTEVVLTSGQPVTTRRQGGYQPIGPEALSADEILALIDGTALADLLDGGGGVRPVQVGARNCRAEVNQFGELLMVRLLRGPRTATATPIRGVPVQAPPPPEPPPPPPASFDLPDSSAELELPTFEAPSFGTPEPEPPPRMAITFSAPAAEPAPTPAPAPEPPPSPDWPERARPAGPHESKATAAPSRRSKAATTIPPVFAEPALAPLRPIATAQAPPAFVALVEDVRRRRATDLHVTAGLAAMARGVDGLTALGAVLDDDAVDALLLPLLTPVQRSQLDQRGYVDTAIDLGPVARLRANFSRTRAGLKGAFRVVLPAPPTLEQLGLPPELAKVTTYHQGLVVIAGPNGHGKTTTLAALIDLINGSKPHHILTVEDPVEILHPRKRAVISQREVGSHTRSFASALKASLREDPDVIVIGELRDRETVEIALTAAETGHLVMATMSTPSAAKTLDRLIDMFPPGDQPQVRSSLASALRFVVAQRLLPSADGTSLVAAVELLTGVLPLAALIRDDKLYQVGSLQQRGRAFGMIRFDDSLLELIRSGKISEEVGLRTAESRKELTSILHPAPAAPPPPSAAANIKSRLGGLFGKKDKD